jgi:hypothetical protein
MPLASNRKCIDGVFIWALFKNIVRKISNKERFGEKLPKIFRKSQTFSKSVSKRHPARIPASRRVDDSTFPCTEHYTTEVLWYYRSIMGTIQELFSSEVQVLYKYYRYYESIIGIMEVLLVLWKYYFGTMEVLLVFWSTRYYWSVYTIKSLRKIWIHRKVRTTLSVIRMNLFVRMGTVHNIRIIAVIRNYKQINPYTDKVVRTLRWIQIVRVLRTNLSVRNLE